MPFYEYQCEKCSEIYEIFLRNGEKAPDECEICGGSLHKIISVSSFQLKGSGLYMTDYAKRNTSPSSEPKSGNSETNKSDTKASGGDLSDKVKEKKAEKKPAITKETVKHP